MSEENKQPLEQEVPETAEAQAEVEQETAQEPEKAEK